MDALLPRIASQTFDANGYVVEPLPDGSLPVGAREFQSTAEAPEAEAIAVEPLPDGSLPVGSQSGYMGYLLSILNQSFSRVSNSSLIKSKDQLAPRQTITITISLEP